VLDFDRFVLCEEAERRWFLQREMHANETRAMNSWTSSNRTEEVVVVATRAFGRCLIDWIHGHACLHSATAHDVMESH